MDAPILLERSDLDAIIRKYGHWPSDSTGRIAPSCGLMELNASRRITGLVVIVIGITMAMCAEMP
eukprot:2915677-Pleurochrysis_carterae.AAC.1